MRRINRRVQLLRRVTAAGRGWQHRCASRVQRRSLRRPPLRHPATLETVKPPRAARRRSRPIQVAKDLRALRSCLHPRLPRRRGAALIGAMRASRRSRRSAMGRSETNTAISCASISIARRTKKFKDRGAERSIRPTGSGVCGGLIRARFFLVSVPRFQHQPHPLVRVSNCVQFAARTVLTGPGRTREGRRWQK